MKIIDCFMLNDELEMLEYRLSTLYKHVDYFVLVESNVTHQGAPKPIYYALYKDRFEKYNDKIIHILTTDIPKNINDENVINKTIYYTDEYHYREQLQRTKIIEGLKQLSLDYEDIVLVSNIDEIPDPESFKELTKYLPMSPVIYRQTWFVWNKNTKHSNKWYGTTAFYYTHIIQNNNILNETKLVSKIKNFEDYFYVDYGWHLNWFGNQKTLINKIFNSSKLEYQHKFFTRKKYLRDLSRDNKFPNPNPDIVKYLKETSISELPKNYDEIPHYDANELPNIYDCFIYDGQVETLKLRLSELYEAVDYFIILEGSLNNKNYLFPLISSELEKYDDKIVYIQLEDYTTLSENSYLYEIDKIKDALFYLNLNDNDFIYFSEIECIPEFDSFEINFFDFERYELDFVSLKMRHFYQDFKHDIDEPYWGTILTNWSKLKNNKLSDFFLLRSEPVHSIVSYRGWFLCNFENDNDTVDLNKVIYNKEWDYYPTNKDFWGKY
jgi:beta-1,4-mannosyl-glycoprotein beta-1,4-N-acetylglucosaminyltransferase